ncbi:MAG: hypothetical protein ACXW04_04430 [Methylobacter sp.]
MQDDADQILARKNEVLAIANVKATKALETWLPTMKKIGQLVDLCFELVPESQSTLIRKATRKKNI